MTELTRVCGRVWACAYATRAFYIYKYIYNIISIAHQKIIFKHFNAKTLKRTGKNLKNLAAIFQVK